MERLLRRLTGNVAITVYTLATGLLTATVAALGDDSPLSKKGVAIADLIAAAFLLSAIAVRFGGNALARARRRRGLRKVFLNSVYSKVNFDWRILEDGTFEAINTYTLKNIGDMELAVFPEDDGVWFRDPTAGKIEISVPKTAEGQQRIVDAQPSFRKSLHSPLIGRTTYIIAWPHSFIPPLQPNEEFTYQVDMTTPKTEIDAFADDGTLMGFPANLPCEDAHLSCVAPKDYVFEILGKPFEIDKHAHHKLPTDDHDLPAPTISGSGSRLDWSLLNLLGGRRYSIRYRLVKR